jgi:polyisoprenyl-teichoic acid--peptidoglycan teichoic acid transferase
MKHTHNKQKKQKQPVGVTPEYAINRSIPNPAYIPSNMPRRKSGASFNANTPQPKQQKPKPIKKPRRWKKIIKRSFLTLLVLAVICVGYVGWKFITNEVKVFGWGGLWSLIDPGPLNSQGGRVNILLAGDSVGRTDGGGGQQLTDSIMIVSVDMQNHTAFLLSVPRDLYVNIPGFGYSKINATAEDGASNYGNDPSSGQNGMGLLEQVVSQNFGIPINYYALIDYDAFESAVNAVGGITVNIQSTDPRGLYDASAMSPTNPAPLVDLTNGEHELNGQEALNLARARGDTYGSYGFGAGDFVRTGNQRQMLIAIKTKAVSAGVMSNPIKLGELFDSFGDNVATDMSLGNAKKLYDITKQIKNSDIQSEGLNNVNGKDLLASYYTPDGEDALVPAAGISNYSQIQAFVSQLTDASQ